MSYNGVLRVLRSNKEICKALTLVWCWVAVYRCSLYLSLDLYVRYLTLVLSQTDCKLSWLLPDVYTDYLWCLMPDQSVDGYVVTVPYCMEWLWTTRDTWCHTRKWMDMLSPSPTAWSDYRLPVIWCHTSHWMDMLLSPSPLDRVDLVTCAPGRIVVAMVATR